MKQENSVARPTNRITAYASVSRDMCNNSVMINDELNARVGPESVQGSIKR